MLADELFVSTLLLCPIRRNSLLYLFLDFKLVSSAVATKANSQNVLLQVHACFACSWSDVLWNTRFLQQKELKELKWGWPLAIVGQSQESFSLSLSSQWFSSISMLMFVSFREGKRHTLVYQEGWGTHNFFFQKWPQFDNMALSWPKPQFFPTIWVSYFFDSCASILGLSFPSFQLKADIFNWAVFNIEKTLVL